jgi:hypothetical protein
MFSTEASAPRRAFSFVVWLLLALAAGALAVAGAARAQPASEAAATGRVHEAPLPCVLVASGDGRMRATAPQQLPAEARRQLRTRRRFLEQDAGDRSEAKTVTTSTAAYADADITVNYTGFTDPARQAFQRAVDVWARHIDSEVQITVNAEFDQLEPDVLGFAGANYVYSGYEEMRDGLFYASALADAITGQNLSEINDSSRDDGVADIGALFSSRASWHYGANPETAEIGEYDFTTVVLHELGHGLGFAGSMRVEGGQGRYGIGEDNIPLVYDRFAEDLRDNRLLNDTFYPNPSEALASVLTDDDAFDRESSVQFDGETARRGAPESGVPGSPPPKLFTPDQWDPGSSYSHLDEEEYPGATGDPDALMTPQFGRQEAARNPGGITCGMFADMGWPLAIGCRTALGLAEVALQNVEATFEQSSDGDERERVRVAFSTTAPGVIECFVIERCFGSCDAGSGDFRGLECDDGSGDVRGVEKISAQTGKRDYSVALDVPSPGRYTFLVRQVSTNDVEIERIDEERIEVEVGVPENQTFTRLTEAFPNPFQDETQMRLVARSEDGQDRNVNVTAVLYDARGRQVRTVFTGNVDGQRIVRINDGGLSSGVYYLRVEGEDFQETRSLVLVR